MQTSEEFEIIERIARAVSSVRGTKTDYAYLATELEQAIPFDVFGVVLLRHDRQSLRVIVCYHKESDWVPLYHQRPLADSMLARMQKEPQLTVREYPDGLDALPSECGDALSNYHQLTSTLIAPLLVDDRLLGTLELGSTEPQAYASPAMQRLVDAIARVLATAIESAQLGGNTAIQDRQRRALKNVTSALTEKVDLSAILKQIVTGIADSLSVSSCICLWDRTTDQLRLEAQAGLDQQRFEAAFGHSRVVDSMCILGQSLLQRQLLGTNDIAGDERFPASQQLFLQMGLRSILVHPLITGATVYGLLLLCSSEPGGFTPLKADILSLFANQATIAIYNGILIESVQKRSHFQQTIERLEQGYQSQQEKRILQGRIEHDETSLEEERLLLEQVRDATQDAFGISFASFLRFISNSLPTQDERTFQTQMMPVQGEWASVLPQAQSSSVAAPNQLPAQETLSLLTQTAEAALTRAGMVGELGRLLMQLRRSANGVRDAWFMVDLNCVCMYINPAAENLCHVQLETFATGYEQGQIPSGVQGKNLSLKIENVFNRLFPRMHNKDEVIDYLQNFAQDSVYRQEMRCVLARDPIDFAKNGAAQEKSGQSTRKDNGTTDKYYQFTRHPLHDQHGQLAAYALQLQDITEQVRDEKMRSALLSSVSHDLRTPLTTIKAAVSGLLQSEVPWSEEDRQEMLEDINQEADHLNVLVSALVELSRIEMGALILEREWCDTAEVLHGAMIRLGRALDDRKIHLNIQTTLPLIYADHVQLERVFYNLLENALQNGPLDTPIDVILDTINDGAKMLRGRIIDGGEKISEHERERIFRSFYDQHSPRNSMGLAICRGIIEAHQGRIWLDANVKKGPCFVFTLPTHPHMVIPAINDSTGYSSEAAEQQPLLTVPQLHLHTATEEKSI